MTHPILKTFKDTAKRLSFKVEGGLNYLKGNSKPYFSLTAHGFDEGSEFGGCNHEIILKYFPELSDLAALHLSDIDGVPTHAIENGFYWLGGTHWQRPDYTIAAKHFRITEHEAKELTAMFGDSFSETAGFLSKNESAKAKQRLASWVDTQRPRWKAEAEACITKHDLVVYGDQYQAA